MCMKSMILTFLLAMLLAGGLLAWAQSRPAGSVTHPGTPQPTLPMAPQSPTPAYCQGRPLLDCLLDRQRALEANTGAAGNQTTGR